MTRYTPSRQKRYRAWVEDRDREQTLSKLKIWEYFDPSDTAERKAVYIDESGALYLEGERVLTNKIVAEYRQGLEYELTHTPFRSLYSLDAPYSRFALHRSPLSAFEINDIFADKVTAANFRDALGFERVLRKRQLLYDYLRSQGFRLNWTDRHKMELALKHAFPLFQR